MGRRPTRTPLNIFLNDRHVGVLIRASNGAIEFAYDEAWLAWEHAMPISLSLPLGTRRFVGAPVMAVFENLLPDSDQIRQRLAARVGARGTDAFSLLERVGHDCVGALQFLPGEEQPSSTGTIDGATLDDSDIEALLGNLFRAPLGVDRDVDEHFRISLAGAQEKTALLWHEGRWIRPHGTTPTTHILKPEIAIPRGGIGLADSVENEFYCMRLMQALGFPTAHCEITTFGTLKALVVERFDRVWTRDKRLIRLPQEDCCQALSVPPTMKYQADGGPGITQILNLLTGSNDPIVDRLTFFRAQVVFWLLGATDGHAKNFSLFLRPEGAFQPTPLYDVLSVQPMVDAGRIGRNAFKLSMAVGNSRKYRLNEIHGRHFVETGKACGLPLRLINQALDELPVQIAAAIDAVNAQLPTDFPPKLVESISGGARSRADRLAVGESDFP
ncbi:type II toxin-antitoxin system HipA family toxin [Sphingomonas sp. MG17]|uniref:Type II toxin-antitoxin system HipA family toxin n=1 Tax=Sphingomonas tagetis TaxID=2949092 RepID=A0A9X2KNT9_9SPHN|nr:type II toxin-antitoxin system HipA family toxin [Sphingomonas tagetis]MCP3733182.1 type II toxin-antitoxin system HipA family toxin [Sphingomonas tagetis]